MQTLRKVPFIDTHTAGEPTRIVLGAGPELGDGSLDERLRVFRTRHDAFRRATVEEPRGSDLLVGALVVEAQGPGVIFFNNIGFLGMCGHGMIGVAVALAYEGRLALGTHTLQTPVGPVSVTLHDPNTVSIANVPSYRLRKGVRIAVPGRRVYTGDIAWGGNWFFLVDDHGEDLLLERREHLTAVARDIRRALAAEGITGDDGKEIDHIELFGPATSTGADSRNFVLCPGDAYDRSPCGTGTSAKLACLIADGKLRPGEIWRQESIIGTVFEGQATRTAQGIVPSIKGQAFVTAEGFLVMDARDPLGHH